MNRAVGAALFRGIGGAVRALQIHSLCLFHIRAEVKQCRQHVMALEVGGMAGNMDETARRKPTLFEKRQPDPPRAALDPLTAVAALGLAARRALRAIDSHQSPVRQSGAGYGLELPIGWRLGGIPKPLEERLRALVRGTARMKP